MECTDEIEKEDCIVRLDGCGCIVSRLHGGHLVDIADLLNSTGACCIVRTVLNYQSVPRDLTCSCSLRITGVWLC